MPYRLVCFILSVSVVFGGALHVLGDVTFLDSAYAWACSCTVQLSLAAQPSVNHSCNSEYFLKMKSAPFPVPFPIDDVRS